MVRSSLTQVARTAGRGIQSARITRIASPKIGATPIIPKLSVGLPVSIANATSRCISTSGVKRVPITTPDGKPAQDSETPKVARTPANITDSEYHSVADEYLERLLTHLEDIQDVREDVEVEFSVCCTCPTVPPTLMCSLQSLTNKHRLAFSPSSSVLRSAPMLLTSSHPTSRSGCHHPSPAPSATTTSSLEIASTRSRRPPLASGSISVTAQRSTSSSRMSSILTSACRPALMELTSIKRHQLCLFFASKTMSFPV